MNNCIANGDVIVTLAKIHWRIQGIGGHEING